MEKKIAKRFSGLLPIVVDCETGGVDDPDREALLEVAACVLGYNAEGLLSQKQMLHYHVQPFEGAIISPHALEVTQIKPDHPFRFALSEAEMAQDLIKQLKPLIAHHHCRRAILIGHNAAFDLSYLRAAFRRVGLDSSFPFHDFVLLDTATISAVWYRETVLARALAKAEIRFDAEEAHSALYDCEKTADLFCRVINQVDSVRRF